MCVERCFREEEKRLGFCVANSEEKLIRGVAVAETVNTEDTATSGEFKKNRKHKNLWQWLSKGDLKIGTEVLLCTVQEQAIRTNYVKHHIDKTSESPPVQIKWKKKLNVCNI